MSDPKIPVRTSITVIAVDRTITEPVEEVRGDSVILRVPPVPPIGFSIYETLGRCFRDGRTTYHGTNLERLRMMLKDAASWARWRGFRRSFRRVCSLA